MNVRNIEPRNNELRPLINLYRHEQYTHPNIVLDPKATLMAIDRKYAIFAICHEDVLAHTTGPFMYINQVTKCLHCKA